MFVFFAGCFHLHGPEGVVYYSYANPQENDADKSVCDDGGNNTDFIAVFNHMDIPSFGC